MSRVSLDTNILVYLAKASREPADLAKTARSFEILRTLRNRAEVVVPVQVLGELVVVLKRNGVTNDRATTFVHQWMRPSDNPSSEGSTLRLALELTGNRRLQFWDSMILAASIESGCSILLSEDMQDGFTVRGLTVVNPLVDKPHHTLKTLLES